MSETWSFKQYFQFQGGGPPILANEEYELLIDYIGNDKVTLRLQLSGGSFETVEASPDPDHGYYTFEWQENLGPRYWGMIIAPDFRNLQVLVGIVERIPQDIQPDSDMGTFTATKPIGDYSAGSS